MASRKLIVEVVGDASSLERTFKNAQVATTRFGKASNTAKGQLRGLAGGYVGTTAAALAFGAAVKSSFSELFESQKVAAQTDAVLRSTGFAANVTADEVDALAQSLLKISGVDDELIKSGENLLLTFKNIRNEVGVGNDIFNQATKATLDMSVAMGEDMRSSAIRLGKALNDPITGLTALRRVGVQFTAAQREQIQASVKAGDVLAAQKVILEELNAEFGGSAEAAGNTLPGQLNKLRESARNLGATLANIATPALIGLTDSANDLLTAVQNLNDPKVGVPSLGAFFKGLGQRLPAGSESIPTIGPFLGALRGAFHEGGKKAGEGFTEGFADAVANSPRAEAAAARAGRAIGRTVKEEARKALGTGTPFLDLRQAEVEATKQQFDDIAVALRRIVVLQERLNKARGLRERTDLQNAINAEQQRVQAIRDQIRARREAAAEAAKDRRDAARDAAREAARKARERAREAREKARAARDARQFRLLGLGPTGGEPIPGAAGLKKQLGRISDAVKGTFLDTGKTRSLLANIRKLLAGGLGKLSEDVRQAIAQILNDIDQQLKDHSQKGDRTKFRAVKPSDILSGLGLTPEQEREARARLARVGATGTTATGSNKTAFGQPIPERKRGPRRGKGLDATDGRPVVINVQVDGRTIATAALPHLQKEAGRRGKSSRGPNAGSALGFA